MASGKKSPTSSAKKQNVAMPKRVEVWQTWQGKQDFRRTKDIAFKGTRSPKMEKKPITQEYWYKKAMGIEKSSVDTDPRKGVRNELWHKINPMPKPAPAASAEEIGGKHKKRTCIIIVVVVLLTVIAVGVGAWIGASYVLHLWPFETVTSTTSISSITKLKFDSSISTTTESAITSESSATTMSSSAPATTTSTPTTTTTKSTTTTTSPSTTTTRTTTTTKTSTITTTKPSTTKPASTTTTSKSTIKPGPTSSQSAAVASI